MKNYSFYKAILFCCMFTNVNIAAQDNAYLTNYRSKVLDYSQDVKMAQYKTYIRQEKQKTAKANFFPSLSGDANFNYIGNPAEISMALPQVKSPIYIKGRGVKYGVGLTLAQPVYAGGSIKAAYDLAKKETEMSQYEKQLVLDNISYNADVFYWNAVARYEMITVVSDYLTSITDLVGVVKDRVKEGLTDHTDLLMTEVRLNDAEYQLIQAENEAEKARLTLNSYAGIPAEIRIQTDLLVAPVTEYYCLEQKVNEMTEQQSEVKIARNKLDIQKSEAKIANSHYLPKLSVGLNGNYTTPGYDFRADLDPNYAVYAKLCIPIFNWGKRRNTRRSGKYSINIMEQNVSKVTDRIRLEINTALYDYTQAVKKIELTMNSLQKAAENENRTIEKYNEGTISIVEVINAQFYHQEARIHYIQSKLNAQIACSHLKRVTGDYGN